MKKILLGLILIVGVSSSAVAQYAVPADGGMAPDGSLNYVYPGGYPFQSFGPIYPMPQQYWLSPRLNSTPRFRSQQKTGFAPIPPELCQ